VRCPALLRPEFSAVQDVKDASFFFSFLFVCFGLYLFSSSSLSAVSVDSPASGPQNRDPQDSSPAGADLPLFSFLSPLLSFFFPRSLIFLFCPLYSSFLNGATSSESSLEASLGLRLPPPLPPLLRDSALHFCVLCLRPFT